MFHFAVILSFFQFTNSVVGFLDLFQQLCLLFLKFLSGSFSNLPSISFPIVPFSLVPGMCLIICFVCFFSCMQRIVPSMFYQFLLSVHLQQELSCSCPGLGAHVCPEVLSMSLLKALRLQRCIFKVESKFWIYIYVYYQLHMLHILLRNSSILH